LALRFGLHRRRRRKRQQEPDEFRGELNGLLGRAFRAPKACRRNRGCCLRSARQQSGRGDHAAARASKGSGRGRATCREGSSVRPKRPFSIRFSGSTTTCPAHKKLNPVSPLPGAAISFYCHCRLAVTEVAKSPTRWNRYTV